MSTSLRRAQISPNRVLVALLVLILSGCEFQSSITPIDWPTVGPQPFLQATLGPQPSPVPFAPTPVPPPPVFEGIESLDCAEPQAGDNHYGFCRIPGTQDFYTWGECSAECPDGPYPGIQIITVSESESTLFREVIDDRDDKITERREGLGRGFVLGGLGAGLGIPGTIGACFATGGWNFGTGCALVLGAIGVDALLAYLDTKDGLDAHSDLTSPNGLQESAQDLFQQLQAGESQVDESEP